MPSFLFRRSVAARPAAPVRLPGHPPPWHLPSWHLLSWLLVLLVAGCSGSSPSEPGGGSAPLVEIRSYNLVNDARRAAGRQELAFDPAIAEVARRHSRRMRDEGFFDHVDPDGKGPARRLTDAGIGFSLVGENLATVTTRGNPSELAHRLLMDNPGHRANILDARFTEIGVGVAEDGDTFLITQVFVRR